MATAISALFLNDVRPISLALQGGGAHGAFTWGVLDRLLEDERIEIEALSGTSAGAMNAVVLADGIVKNGKEGAREALASFWWSVSRAAMASPVRRDPISVFFEDWSLDRSPSFFLFDILRRFASPYDLNPLNFNPLLNLISDLVDFDRVQSCDRVKIYVSATNVETGVVRVFDRKALTADMVMASACLPHLYQAVEIDGIPYWDGGYAGNPALFPLFAGCGSQDIVVVQINPVFRQGAPRSAQDILNRVNEITFNNSLLKEFRAIDFVARLIDEGRLDRDRYEKVLIHVIHGDEALKRLSASSKLNAEWAFLQHLFEIGRGCTDQWLHNHFDDLNRRSSVDIRAMFEGIGVVHHG